MAKPTMATTTMKTCGRKMVQHMMSATGEAAREICHTATYRAVKEIRIIAAFGRAVTLFGVQRGVPMAHARAAFRAFRRVWGLRAGFAEEVGRSDATAAAPTAILKGQKLILRLGLARGGKRSDKQGTAQG